MTATLSRLILSMVVLMLVVSVYIPIGATLDSTVNLGDTIEIWITNTITILLLVAGWIGVWRGEVQWTKRRVWLTAGAVIFCLLPGVVIGFSMVMAASYIGEAWTIFAGIIWAISWIGSTAVIWRETKAERIERLKMLGINAVACPNCGYNMTGLKQAECPECGAKYTLDQLYAAMREEAV